MAAWFSGSQAPQIENTAELLRVGNVVEVEQAPIGVSVHQLNTELREEVEAVGLPIESNVYDIEPKVIRPKGEQVVCPQDGRIGASYVDCLEGLDNVGVAIFMLSYAWSYRIIDILSALQSFCEDSKPVIDPKRAYVWICCLCKLFLYSFVCVISLSTSALHF